MASRVGSASTRKQHTLEAAVSGMRRVAYVRMVEGDQPRFFVVGVGHRLPVEREVSASVALALLETVPCHYERPRVAGKPAEVKPTAAKVA